MPIERKLAAIMFTDIAGYTEQMSKDEAVAISLLNKKESVLKPLIAQHNGTYVKSIGDGSLSHFNSAVDAATCAKRFQESIYDDKDLNVRVGVHLGDTIFEKGDIRGDGVNIASRLESMAVAGGVFVSKEVHDQLTNQKEFEGVSLGLQSMKGVGRLIEIYGLKGDKLCEPNPDEYQENKVAVHSDSEVPSIAIIPFRNKGKEEDAFYAYGICSDLISDCSSAGLIRVASLERVEELSDLLIEDKAEKLDVRYIATGNLWKMDDMFQLSIEIYDTKETKIMWSDRWEESWDNLPSIKGSLSDGLLKALDTTSKVQKRIETANTEAYEYYLKAKHKYEKRENTDDIEIARGLLNKVIKLDDNLINAKILLGWTYSELGDNDMAMEIYTPALKQAEELGDKCGMGSLLNTIGIVCEGKGNYDKALDYLNRSIKIKEEIDDKIGLVSTLLNIGTTYKDNKGDLDKAMYYCTRSLAIAEELRDIRWIAYSQNDIGGIYNNKGDSDKALDYHNYSFKKCKELGDKSEMGYSLSGIGNVYSKKGDYDKSLDYCTQALKIREELGQKMWMGYSCADIGGIYTDKGDYSKATEYLEKSLAIFKEIGFRGRGLLLYVPTVCLYLSYKNLGNEYDEKEIHTLIKETEYLDYENNLRLYQLLEDTSYLEKAYNQIQELGDNLEPDVAAKFLSYPIPKAIVEEWEKVEMLIDHL